MQPLSAWPLTARQGLVGVFTDIDDTLTTHGAITPDALQAMEQLKSAGLYVIGLNGRPIGWCELPAKGHAESGVPAWPMDAVVAENGAVAWVGSQRRHKIYQQDAATRQHNQQRIHLIGARILREVPGTAITRDSVGRETDLAIDAAEFCNLSPAQIAQVVAIMQAEGLHTTVSSIHIHGCFGLFNKWQGACWIALELLGISLPSDKDRWAFTGDSGNDVSMFAQLEHSIGVANIRSVADRLSDLPRYITPSARGAGFAEVAAAILQARQA
jgi:HAD superfamily hydrolase (TIGR01484 family)